MADLEGVGFQGLVTANETLNGISEGTFHIFLTRTTSGGREVGKGI